MATVLTGFQQTAEELRKLRNQTVALEQKQKMQARAAYQGMTGSGKSRYAAELERLEVQIDAYGARARVADTLGVSPSRVTQLLNSDKNRKNGK